MELSIFANVDYLITGNTNDFTNKYYDSIDKIFLDNYFFYIFELYGISGVMVNVLNHGRFEIMNWFIRSVIYLLV